MNHDEAQVEVQRVVKAITAARKAAGLTPYRIGKLTGLSAQAIHLIERGERSPTLHSLFLVCDALEMKLEDVLAEIRGKRKAKATDKNPK